MYLRKSLREIFSNFPFEEGDFSILIYGETGVGKEVLAKAIYDKLKIKGKFVPCDVSSFSKSLFESEIFGYKRGSFTDAKEDKKGLLEEADGGVLFLDEVSNIPLDLQPKLLRVLETKKFRRIGETEERKADFLLISATNKDLYELVKEGKFREDLYYRICHFYIKIKPLREEKEEIILLINEFLKGKNFRFTKEALDFIMCYPWYGNVRELKNFCVFISLKCKNKDVIDIEDFPENMLNSWCDIEKIRKQNKIKDKIECFKNKYLKIMIEDYLKNGGNIEGLCEELQVKKSRVYEIIKNLNINLKNVKKGETEFY